MDLGQITEAEFQANILDAVRTLGLQAYHTHDSRRSQKGFPDLVIVGATGVLFRELKTMTGKVTEEQKYWLSILHAAGADVAVWRPNLWPDVIMRDLRALGRLELLPPSKSSGMTIPKQRSW